MKTRTFYCKMKWRVSLWLALLTLTLLFPLISTAQVVKSNYYELSGYPAIQTYYTFEQNFEDYSGNNNHLMPYNVQFTSGKHGTQDAAVDFNQSTSYLFGENGYNWLSGGSFTLNMWVNTPQTGLYNNVLYAQKGATDNMWLTLTNDRLTFNYYNGASTDVWVSDDSISSNLWYMLTATVMVDTSVHVELYINGNPTTTSTMENTDNVITSATREHYVGAADSIGTDVFTGFIDDIKVFDGQLAAAQVLDMYNYETANTRIVTFEVDMSYQIALNSFDTTYDYVEIMGSFNGWSSGVTMNPTGNGRYQAQISGIPIGDELQFKFRLNGDWGNAEFPNGSNRYYYVQDITNNLTFLYNDEEYDDNLAINYVNSPYDGATGSTEPVSIVVKNLGYNPITAFVLSASSPTIGATLVDSVFYTLNIGEEYMHTFSGTADLSGPGPHEFTFYCDYVNDEFREDDTVFYTINQDPNLVAHFPFTSNAEDVSNNAFYAGVNGSAFFDGSSVVIGDYDIDYLDLPPEIIMGLTDFTIETNVKINNFHTTGTTYPNNHVFSVATYEDANELLIYYSALDGKWGVIFNGKSFDYYDTSIEDGGWHHIALVREEYSLRFYLDGAQLGSAALAGSQPIEVDYGGFIIGQDQDDVGGGYDPMQSLAGQLSDFKVFKNVQYFGDIITFEEALADYTFDAPAIDGIVDAYWDSLPVYNLQKQIVGTPTVTDLSAYFKVGYDNSNLYVLVDVTDDNTIYMDYLDSWLSDNVELYFDPYNEKNTYYDYNDVQLRFNYGSGQISGLPDNLSGDLESISFAQTDKADGYIFEVAIPWYVLHESVPIPFHTMGFDVFVTDAENDAVVKNKLGWNSNSDNNWQDASLFGNLTYGFNYLRAFYPFDGNAVDSAGTNDGIVNNSYYYEDRFYNFTGAIQMLEDSSCVNLGTNLNLINDAPEFSLVAWVQANEISVPGTNQQYTILAEREGGNNYQFAIMDDAIYFSIWDGGTEHYFQSDYGQVTIGNWQMLTVVYTGSEIQFYNNKHLINNISATFNIDNNASMLRMGATTQGNDVFKGSLDDVFIFDRALNQMEIDNLVNRQGYVPTAMRDLYVSAITYPSSGCNLGTAEYPTIEIGNSGMLSASGFDLIFRINGSDMLTETVNDTVFPYSSLSYTFINPIDMSVYGGHIDFEVEIIYGADDYSENNSYYNYLDIYMPPDLPEGWYLHTQCDNLPSNYMNDIAQDTSGNIWVATDLGVAMHDTTGWIFYNKDNALFNDNQFLSIYVDKNSNLVWAGGVSALYTYDGAAWNSYDYNNSPIFSAVNDITSDANGDIWLATNDGAMSYNGVEWTTFNTGNSGISSDIVNAVLMDSSQNMWFATNAGVSKYNYITWQIYNSSNSGFIGDNVTDMTVDPTTFDIWFTTAYDAGNIMKLSNDTLWTVYNESNIDIFGGDYLSVKADQFGNIYVGTEFEGMFKKYGANWINYNGDSGLTGTENKTAAHINDIFEAKNGDIWIASAEGLFQKEPRNIEVLSADIVPVGCDGTLGSITLHAIGNSAGSNLPLEYSIDGGTNYQVNNEFTGLSEGYYDLAIRDADLFVVSKDSFYLGSEPIFATFPYYEDFEGETMGWKSGSLSGGNSWQLGMPEGYNIMNGFSGNNVWATNLNGEYEGSEISYVESPCFDFSSVTNPMLSVETWRSFDDLDDGVVLQYTTDNGSSWVTIGANDGIGANWYNWTSDSVQGGLATIGQYDYWSDHSDNWEFTARNISELAGEPLVRFRFLFGSDTTDNYTDGFAFDDFSIGEVVTGITEDFNDNEINNWNWSDLFFDMVEKNQEMHVSANVSGYDGFEYAVQMMDISEHPYLSVRLKADVDVNVRFSFVDANGTWSDRYNGTGFAVIPDGQYHNYVFDFTDRLFNYQNIPVMADQITKVAVQVNPGSEFTGEFYMDDLRLGSDVSVDNNLNLIWVDLGEPCANAADTPIEFRVTNNGNNPLFGFDANINIDGMDLGTESYTDSIFPGDTVIFIMTATANLYNNDYVHNFAVQAIISNEIDDNAADNLKTFTKKVFGAYTDKPNWLSYNTCSGLIDNNVWAADQDVDGNIWLSGFYGISKFDGSTWTTYTTEDGLANDYSWTLQAASDGTVWFPSTTSGFTQWTGTEFITTYPFDSLVFEECSYEDTEGNMWFGSYSGNGVAMFDGTNWTQYVNETSGAVEDIDQAPNGDMLFTSDGLVYRYDGTAFTEFLFDTVNMYVSEIFRDNNYITWFYGSGILKSYDGSTFTDYSAQVESIGYVQAIEQDADGNLWFGGMNGAARFDGTNWLYFMSGDGLIPSQVWSIAPDANGSVWLGTRLGVSNFTEGPEILMQVDMQYMIANGLFDPQKDYVAVPGEFNGWNDQILSDDDGDEIYETNIYGTFVGDTLEYKFRLNGDWCDIHEFQYLENRKYVIQKDGDTVYHVFNDDMNPMYRSVTLNLNMNKAVYLGQFNPDMNSLQFGIYQNCLGYRTLKDDDGDLIYSATYDSLYLTNTARVPYIVRINAEIEEPVGYQDFKVRADTVNFTVNRYWNNDGAPLTEFDYIVTDYMVQFYNLTYNFADTANYLWSFGNGQSSTNFEPVFTYNEPGAYEVCLTATDNMGYSSKFCQTVEVLGDTLQSSCLANFDFLVSTDTVFFTDNSTGENLEYFWEFGDGFVSNDKNPEHIYAEGGYYDVMLSVHDTVSGCFNTKTKQINIDLGQTNCYADFVYEVDGLTVTLTNTSEGNPSTYYWAMGDDQGYLTQENPTYTYDKGGFYEVCLTIYNDSTGCFDETCEIIQVSQDTTSCYADFSYIINGAEVDFLQKAQGKITNYFWNFDDGITDTTINPTHIYENSGYYWVELTVYDSITDCFDSKSKVVFVVVPEDTTATCQADFDYLIDTNAVVFNNKSTAEHADYWWDFGDGTFDTQENPTHSYKSAGYYEVYLSVYDSVTYCLSEATRVLFIEDGQTEVCNATFESFVQGLEVDFRSSVTPGITDYFWDFGDGKFSSDSSTIHMYDDPGYYEVWLTVYNENTGCLDEHSEVIFLEDSLSVSCKAQFQRFINQGMVTFTNNSEGSYDEIFWDFGDGTYSTEENPVHTYTKADYYNVCLSVFDTESGCYDEVCKFIPVTDVGNVASCNATFDYFVKDLEVNFKGHVLGDVTDYFWDFGDGYYGYDSIMSHTYDASGYYGVSFTVYNDSTNCLDEYTDVVFVFDSTAVSCHAEFNAFANESDVTFTNTSSGENITDYFWWFGDGYVSSDTAPTHTYSDPGFYEVELTIYDDESGCLDTYAKNIFVIDTTQAICQADFSFFADGNTITFTDNSKGEITDIFWDFGDGYYSSDSVVSHTYVDPGYYEVILTVYNSETDCLDEFTDVVVVIGEEEICKSDFTYYPDGYTVTFTSMATGGFEQHFWDFDDGTNSNVANPVHTFTEPGYYEVAYSVIDVDTTATDTTVSCFDTRYKVIFVEGESGSSTTAELKAKFSQINTPNTFHVNFSDESLGDINTWYWDFGDNSPAVYEQNPVYEYDTNDYYRVCLTVSNAENQKTKCKFIAVGDVSNSSTAFFTYFADSLTATAHFNNKSLGNIVSQSWDFGDGYTSIQKNPSHTYADTGYYAVCLTTESATGVFKTYCKDVRVGNAIENPCLFSCVWPGDANNDLEANHYDLMTIGLNYGLEGPKRENASIAWYGQFAQNWSTYQLDGTNNKYGDCNGDGIIDANDTLAINENFAFSHFEQPDYKSPNSEWIIACVWDNENKGTKAYEKKSKVTLSPPLKKEPGDLYAIGYEIEVIGGEKIIWSTIDIDFSNSWIGTVGEDILTVTYIDSTEHIIFIGTTRIDQENVSGSGTIAELTFEFKDGETPTGVSFNVTTRGGIEATGETVTVDGSIELELDSPVAICAGDTAVLNAGEGFDMYQWSTGDETSTIAVTSAGLYTVTVADSTGTTASDTIEVIVNPLPDIDLGENISQDDSLIIDAGAGFADYLWSTGETTQSITVKQSGDYWVRVTNESGCSSTDTVNVTITGIFEDISENIAIYPNPNNGKFWLVYEFNSATNPVVEIINVNGETVWRNEIISQNDQKSMIEIDDLEQGVYYVKVIDDDKTGTLRFVVL